MSSNFAIKRSTDIGAPPLNGTAGALTNVLDWALDTSNTTDGWEIAYTTTNVRVYRSRSGLRHYLKVSNPSTSKPQIWAYENMTDINTGTGPYASAVRYFTAGSGAGAPYIIIRTSKFFLMFAMETPSDSWYLAYAFGEFKSELSADNWNSMLISAGTATTATFYLTNTTNGWSTSYCSGVTAATAANWTCAAPRYSSGTAAVDIRLLLTAPNLVTWSNQSDPRIAAFPVALGDLHQHVRGYIPYLLHLPYADAPAITGDTFVYDGATYEIVILYSTGARIFAFRTSNDVAQP